MIDTAFLLIVASVQRQETENLSFLLLGVLGVFIVALWILALLRLWVRLKRGAEEEIWLEDSLERDRHDSIAGGVAAEPIQVQKR